MGHAYTVLFVLLLQGGCFREMASARCHWVHMRHKRNFVRIFSQVRVGVDPALERRLPGFLGLQWGYFGAALCLVYGRWLESLVTTIDTSNLPRLFVTLVPYQGFVCMLLYATVFVASVLSLQPPQACYRYQMNRLSFTVVSLIVIFGQMQGTMAAIYKGLIWYFVPSAIVATNDIMAYFTGVAVGRRFIDKPLLQLSPNKTWEGFIGAILWTAIFAFSFTGHVASFKWMVCPATSLTWKIHDSIACTPHHIFLRLEQSSLPAFWPAAVPLRPVQLHMVSVAFFASVIGPFGGFLAAGIKRAFDIKDFAAFLPGHGGLMDRNDCQMLTALYVAVHLSTFVRDL
jgi:phosphatidate cytidylyltransferase